MARHGPALLRVANQFSLCHDDALDAYQRALEIYLRRLDTVEAATEGAWLRVVVKHEAMAIRRARAQSVDHDDIDLDASAAAARDVEEQIAGGERVDRSVEALRALKPDEAKALMLKAHGLSYQEIGRRFGWTYTKVNRSITEGRKRFLKEFKGIEDGEACARYEEALSALADGRATSAQVVSIRPAPAPLRGLPRRGARAAPDPPPADRAAAARPAVAPDRPGGRVGRRHQLAVRERGRRRAARGGGRARRAVPDRHRRDLRRRHRRAGPAAGDRALGEDARAEAPRQAPPARRGDEHAGLHAGRAGERHQDTDPEAHAVPGEALQAARQEAHGRVRVRGRRRVLGLRLAAARHRHDR